LLSCLLLGSLSLTCLLLGSLSLAECRLLVPRDGDLAPPPVVAATAPQVSVRRQRGLRSGWAREGLGRG
jgi:hypothetical protein